MTEFFHMGGYAFFVWTSYAIVASFFLYHFFAPKLKRKKLLIELANAHNDD